MSEPTRQTQSAIVAKPGAVLAGRYKLERPIASGGMAQVWRGFDESLGRKVAVKVLHPHLAQDDEGFVLRFRREAIAAARLSHKSIVAIFDTVSTSQLEAIVMQLIEGDTLRTALNEQPILPERDIARIGIHICEALSEAHRHGIVHRDIKPANIILGPTRVMVTDFGIAKAGNDIDLTATGTLLGTAKYLAPEQVLGERIDPRSDLYSLGIVLYEAATGSVPFLADSDAATALKRLHRDPPAVRSINSDVSTEMAVILQKSLERDPDDRYQRASELRAAFIDFLGRRNSAGSSTVDRKSGENTAEFNPFTQTQPTLSKRSSPRPDRRPPHPSRRKTGANQPGNPASRRSNTGHRPFEPETQPQNPQPKPRRNTPRGHNQATQPQPSTRRARTNERWNDDEEPVSSEDSATKSTKSWSLPAIAILAVITAIVVLISLLTRSKGAQPDLEEPTSTELVTLVSAQDFDPLGTDGERPELKSNAIDGESSSSWRTETYKRPNFGGLKEGVGLIIEMDGQTTLSSIEIETPTQAWSMEIYVGESFSEDPGSWDEPPIVISNESGTVTRTFDDPKPSGSQVLLWITDHGSTDGSNLFQLSEVRISK